MTMAAANSRIARFVMEVAPPQFVSVMRHRTAKMLDTITEEEKDVADSSSSSSKCFSNRASSNGADSKYLLRGVRVQRSLAIFE